MNAHAVRIGLKRGWTELRQTLTTGQDLRSYLVPTVILLFSMFMQRDSKVHGTTFSLGTMMLPGVLGLVVLWGGFLAVAQQLAVEREDGTLLRAKALPNGMPAYLIGKIVVVGGMTLISMLIILVPGLLLFPGLDFAAPHSWMTLLWVAVLGMVASMPLGAIAVSRRFDRQTQRKIDRVLRRSVEFAFAEPSASAEFVRGYAQELSEEVTRRHIELFVNEYSVDLGAEGKKAVCALLERKDNVEKQLLSNELLERKEEEIFV